MSLPNRFGCREWCFLGCCLLIQCWASLAYAAPPVSEEILTQRRKALASLSETQRQELIRKYEQYKKLDDGERQKLQTLHDAMEVEPDLKRVMQNYCEWLKNLDLTQREELRQAKTPEQKRNLVVRFYQEQIQRKEEAWKEIIPPPPENRAVPALTSAELKEVMSEFEKELVNDQILDQKTQAALAQTSGSQRYKLLMKALGEYRHRDGQVHEFEIPKDVQTKLTGIIKKGGERQRLTELLRHGDGQKASKIFFGLLMRNTADEVRREFNGSGAEQFKEVLFNSMPVELQVRYSQARPNQQDLILIRAHLEEIWLAFSAAGDLHLPRPSVLGNPRGRGAPPQPLRNGEENRSSRLLQERVPDGPPEGRRPKVE